MRSYSCRSYPWSKIIILISSFVLQFIPFGMVTSFGVMYSELRDQFGTGAAETSWVASLSAGLLLASGLVAGILEKQFGCRVVAMGGSTLTGVGLVASSFVPSLYWLYLTYGVITGVGFGMMHLVANVTVNLKFGKRRSLASAVASSGGACGNIVIPWLTTRWLDVYGWRQTFLLLAGIGIQGIVFGAVILNLHTSNESKRSLHNPDHKTLRAEMKAVLKTKAFLMFALSGFCVSMAYFVPFVMIPELAKGKGLSSTDVALFFTATGVSSIVGRILVSVLTEVAQTNRMWTLAFALLGGGGSTIGCAFIYDKWLFMVYAVILGVFTGTFGFLQSVIVVDLLGTELQGIAFGFLTSFQGIAVIIGPPSAGWITDMTNNYIVTFTYAGILFCLGSFFICIIRIREHCSVSQRHDHTVETSNTENCTINGGHTNSNFVWDTKL